jgi:hypothetical protein
MDHYLRSFRELCRAYINDVVSHRVLESLSRSKRRHRQLEFPRTLSQLESCLGLVSCFRQYIYQFAHKADPLFNPGRHRWLWLADTTASKLISELEVNGWIYLENWSPP